ncbi:hypothetical protein BH11PSE10_BH11PSE10_13990 [soil metagenome]
MGVWRLRSALHTSEGGQWYRARHALAVEQLGAVLVLRHSERAADVMLRFADQIGELGRLSHPAIALPTDSGVTAAGLPYLIIEGANSACCKPILAACATLGLRARLQWLSQLCEALRYAHQQGWLLSEIDPAMLWIDSFDQRPLLMGVGLVRMPDPSDPFDRGVSLGASAAYQAPELLAGAPPSLATEAFGLGALLTVLIEGRLPRADLVDLGLEFDGDGPDTDAGRLAVLTMLWPHLNGAELQGLLSLLRQSAAPLPADRHASAEALADDLRAWLAIRPVAAPVFAPVPAPSIKPVAAVPRPAVATADPVPARGDWLGALGRRWRQMVGAAARDTLPS